MAFQLPNGIPNFNTNIPQMPPALETYGKMLQLKALSGQVNQQQQMQPLQVEQAQQGVQASELENQQRQLELSSQQAMVKAWSDPDFLKGFTGTPAADASGIGFDPNALTSSLISKGVLPKDAMAMTSQFVDRSAKMADTLKAQAQTGEAETAIRSKTLDALGAKLGSINDLPVAEATKALESFKQSLVKNPKAYPGMTQQEMAELYGATLDHLPGIENLLGLEGKIADFHKSKAEAVTAQQKVIPQGGGLSPEAQQSLNEGVAKDVAVATNPAVQQGKEQVAAVEGAARANVEINTKRQELSDTQYQTAIGADERLNRMEKSYNEGLKGNQQAMLALLTDHIGMTLGLQKGARITKDIINEAAQSQPWLDKVGAKFDDNGYLSGVTLGKQQMGQMLQLGYTARENAWDAAKSTSQLYGVKPPPHAEEIYNKRPPGQNSLPAQQLQVGQSVNVKGKTLKVTAVHPDGSFDAQ